MKLGGDLRDPVGVTWDNFPQRPCPSSTSHTHLAAWPLFPDVTDSFGGSTGNADLLPGTCTSVHCSSCRRSSRRPCDRLRGSSSYIRWPSNDSICLPLQSRHVWPCPTLYPCGTQTPSDRNRCCTVHAARCTANGPSAGRSRAAEEGSQRTGAASNTCLRGRHNPVPTHSWRARLRLCR